MPITFDNDPFLTAKKFDPIPTTKKIPAKTAYQTPLLLRSKPFLSSGALKRKTATTIVSCTMTSITSAVCKDKDTDACFRKKNVIAKNNAELIENDICHKYDY